MGASALPATAAEICAQYGQEQVDNGRYQVGNNRWGSGEDQCVEARDGGFTITKALGSKATNGAPKSYPVIYAGCHYGNCTNGSGLPRRASEMGGSTSSVSIDTAPGEWNASYDIWLDPQKDQSGQNTGTEIMIWVNRQGAPVPIGSAQGKVTIAGTSWTVWEGRGPNWNVISFVRDTPATSADLPIGDFVAESVKRGQSKAEWYVTSVQFGFEPWVGGAGLSASNFSFSIGDGAPTSTRPAAGESPKPTLAKQLKPTAPGSALPTPGRALPAESDSEPAAPARTAALIGVQQGLCATPRSKGPEKVTLLALRGCNGSASQAWDSGNRRLRHVATGLCLDIGTAQYRSLKLSTCSSTDRGQEWVLDSEGQARNSATRRCVDGQAGGTSAGTRLVAAPCAADKPSQQWKRR